MTAVAPIRTKTKAELLCEAVSSLPNPTGTISPLWAAPPPPPGAPGIDVASRPVGVDPVRGRSANGEQQGSCLPKATGNAGICGVQLCVMGGGWKVGRMGRGAVGGLGGRSDCGLHPYPRTHTRMRRAGCIPHCTLPMPQWLSARPASDIESRRVRDCVSGKLEVPVSVAL